MTKACIQCGAQIHRAAMENDHNWSRHVYCHERCRRTADRVRRAAANGVTYRVGAARNAAGWTYFGRDAAEPYATFAELLDARRAPWRGRSTVARDARRTA